MSYRETLDALIARRDALRRALRKGEPVGAALLTVNARIDETRQGAALRVLNGLRVATPCPASWDAMAGDDRVRDCALCEKNVYDLSGLTSGEAVALLARHEGEACVRLHRRHDGTVITADCQVGRQRRMRRTAVGAGILAAAGALALAWPEDSAPAPPEVEAQATPAFELDEERFFAAPTPEPSPPPAVEMGMVLPSPDFGCIGPLLHVEHESSPGDPDWQRALLGRVSAEDDVP